MLGADHYYNEHRWYEPQAGKYMRSDPTGLSAGPNPYLYAGGSPLVYRDLLGLDIQICSRKAFAFAGVGNHAYFWDDRSGILPDQRSCGRGRFGPEMGPQSDDLPPGMGDSCVVIPGSPGKEDELMSCCERSRDTLNPVERIFFPGVTDCQNMLGR